MDVNTIRNIDLDELLPTRQAAEFLDLSEKALQAKRIRGGGPAFIRISSRCVRYSRRDLLEWVDAHRYTSTSEHSAKNSEGGGK